jgi:hypothetical protein
MTRVAIVQSCYLPWKGHFDLINSVDVFVFLDDVQYTTRDWRSRNKIKRVDGKTAWLSVPVLGGRDQLINQAVVDDSQPWRSKHVQSLRHAYGKTPFGERYLPAVYDALEDESETLLSRLNVRLTKLVAGFLGVTAEFRRSDEFNAPGTKDDKLLAIVKAVGGTSYLSGPSARDYIVPEKFERAGVALAYMDYGGYPAYEQGAGEFEHAVTALDLLCWKGPEAPDYIWGKRRERAAGA